MGPELDKFVMGSPYVSISVGSKARKSSVCVEFDNWILFPFLSKPVTLKISLYFSWVVCQQMVEVWWWFQKIQNWAFGITKNSGVSRSSSCGSSRFSRIRF